MSCVLLGPGFATEPRGTLGKKLSEVTGLAKTFFTLGGSEANENAITNGAAGYRPRQNYYPLPQLSRGHDGFDDRFPAIRADGRSSRVVPGIVRVFDPYCLPLPVWPEG